jgi:transposase
VDGSNSNDDAGHGRKDPFRVGKIVAAIKDNHTAIPANARAMLRLPTDQRRSLHERVVLLDRELVRRATEDAEVKRPVTISRNRPVHGDGARCTCPADTGLQERTRPCGTP